MTLDGIAPFLVDPNSTLGLRLEGATARLRGRDAADNPFSRSHPRSLAELHWWEGWCLEGQRLAGERPDVPAAVKFAKAQRASLSNQEAQAPQTEGQSQ